MTCDGVRDRLHDYIDRELSQFERAQVEAHLRRCPNCAEELRLLRATVALLADLDEVDVPASFRPALMARIAAMPAPVIPLPAPAARRPRTAPLWQRWGLQSVAAAAVVALVAVNIVPSLRERVYRIDANPVAEQPVSPVVPGPGPDASVTLLPEVTVPPGPSEDTPDPNPVIEPAGPGPGADNPRSSDSEPSDPPEGSSEPTTSVEPNTQDPAPPADPTTSIVANPEATVATPGAPVIPPTPSTQGMTRFKYGLTVQTPDVAQTAAWLRELAGNLVKDEQPLASGGIQFHLEVTEDTAEQWVAQLAKDLGTVTPHSTETEPLQAQFDLRSRLLNETQAELENALITAEDPNQPEAVRRAAQQQADIFYREITRLKAELADLEQRDLHASIVLTLEAQR